VKAARIRQTLDPGGRGWQNGPVRGGRTNAPEPRAPGVEGVSGQRARRRADDKKMGRGCGRPFSPSPTTLPPPFPPISSHSFPKMVASSVLGYPRIGACFPLPLLRWARRCSRGRSRLLPSDAPFSAHSARPSERALSRAARLILLPPRLSLVPRSLFSVSPLSRPEPCVFTLSYRGLFPSPARAVG